MNKKEQFIQQGFDNIANKYDFFNNLVSFGRHKSIKKSLATQVYSKLQKQKPKGDIVDLCCGTGDISYFLADLLPSSYKIIGIDFSDKMLTIAKQRKKAKKIDFINSNILPLPLSDSSAAVITIGFGLRNLINLDFALQEIYRSLAKGGIFACLDMGKVTFPLAKQLFHLGFFLFSTSGR